DHLQVGLAQGYIASAFAIRKEISPLLYVGPIPGGDQQNPGMGHTFSRSRIDGPERQVWRKVVLRRRWLARDSSKAGGESIGRTVGRVCVFASLRRCLRTSRES